MATEPFASCAERGYHPFGDYLRRRFGGKVHKVSLHAGFTCPNRDGRVGVGGCTYCINESFNPQAGAPLRSIGEQMADGIAYMRRRFHAEKVFAYFQAFTNTYADLDTLRRVYDEAVVFPEVVGLSIGTRPDCVPDEVLDLVQGYTAKVEVWIEYGIQSIHERTLRRINRGHDFEAFRDAVARTLPRGIRVCAHVILGLPGESHEDMMRTAEALQPLGLHGIKLHHLYVARKTALERDYAAGTLRLFTAPEYVRAVCDFLERIPSGVAVQRLVGDTTSSDVLLAPQWPESKSRVLQMITEEFRRRGSVQGARVAT